MSTLNEQKNESYRLRGLEKQRLESMAFMYFIYAILKIILV